MRFSCLNKKNEVPLLLLPTVLENPHSWRGTATNVGRAADGGGRSVRKTGYQTYRNLLWVMFYSNHRSRSTLLSCNKILFLFLFYFEIKDSFISIGENIFVLFSISTILSNARSGCIMLISILAFGSILNYFHMLYSVRGSLAVSYTHLDVYKRQ